MSDIFRFIWSIENFSSCSQKTTDFITSPTFLVEKMDRAKFYLRLFPRGCTDEGVIYCDFLRVTDDEGPESVEFKLILAICVSDSLSDTVISECSAKKGNWLIKGCFKSRKRVFESEKLFLPKDTLTFQCDMSRKSCKSPSLIKCYARTVVQVERHVFSVPLIPTSLLNVTASDVPHQQYSVNVPLQCQTKNHGKFEISFKFSSCSDSDKNAEIKICRIPSSTSEKIPLFVTFKASLPDIGEGSKCLICHEHWLCPEENEWLTSYFLDTSEIEFIRRGDMFSYSCEFAISDGTVTSAVERVFHPWEYQETAPNYNFENNDATVLQTIYTDKKFCDVTLKAENATFPSHKCVLIARSPVFRAMFDSDMKEKATSLVEISDIGDETLKQMLSFIYTGTVEDLQHKSAAELYSAADKYQILDLKKMCFSVLKANLTIENVCDVLELADLHQDSKLEKIARSYIHSNARDLFCSNVWERFMGKRIQLAADVMHKMWLN